MKIVTVNVPESYLDAIKRLVGENGLYPSRSELIRCAVREFLLKELRMIKQMSKQMNIPEIEKFDENNYVRIPKTTQKFKFVYKCPICNSKKELNEESDKLHCLECHKKNNSLVKMELTLKAKDPEPVREFKTYRILRRLEY